MSIDTEIKGEPAQIEGAAEWLRNQLAVKLDSAVDRIVDARRGAETSWDSPAGHGFVSMMTTARDKTHDLHGATKEMAQDLDFFAAKLRLCQNEMRDVRTTASGKGLAVSGFVVQDPGPGPARPPDGFTGTPEEVAGHNKLVDAYDAHQVLIKAYNDAADEAARIDRQYGAACQDLNRDYAINNHAAWIVTIGDILGQAAESSLLLVLGTKKSALLGKADDLLNEASRAVADLQAHPEKYMKRKWLFFKTIDEVKVDAARLAVEGKLNEATELTNRASALDDAKLPKVLKGAGRILGPAGFGIGVYTDYQDGETWTQNLVSQGGSLAVGTGAGLLASAGTGAAMGAAFGSVVPGVGTAVGAVVGTVVGAGVAIFSDGVIDSLFENGPDVGKAWDSGVEALEDTGDAIGKGLSAVGGAIGGLFD